MFNSVYPISVLFVFYILQWMNFAKIFANRTEESTHIYDQETGTQKEEIYNNIK